MGYMKHHAIIVTSYDHVRLEACRNKAIELFHSQVSDIVFPVVNLHESFLIGTDGSDEGYNESDTGDEKRFEYRIWLENFCFSDGSSAVQWVELSYADDYDDPKILNHSK